MSQEFGTLDVSNCACSFGPVVLDGGFAPDTMMTVERASEAWDDVAGCFGDVARSKENDNRATVKLFMLQTSVKNDQLSALYNLDKNTPGGTGSRVFAYVDLGGTTKLGGAQAWIRKAPDQSRAKKVGAVEWHIRVANLVEHHGSNG